MLVVTGTLRSGTSMWMQVMASLEIPIIGSQFPLDWGETLREANSGGFYESLLRKGIHSETNPHPDTGVTLSPKKVKGYAVKIFPAGLVRTDVRFLDHVIVSIRPWREVEASMRYLYMLQDTAKAEQDPSYIPPIRMPPAWRWWLENYTLLTDLTNRRYRAMLVAYDRVLENPEDTLTRVLVWAGINGVRHAIPAIRPEYRKFEGVSSDTLEPEVSAVCDELYNCVYERKITKSFIASLDETHNRMRPRIHEAQARIRRNRIEQNNADDFD